MVRTRRNASDTGGHDPGLPVAGLPAADEGIDDDNVAIHSDKDSDILISINVPLADNITHCECCQINNVLKGFLSLKDLVIHYKEQHRNVAIELKCVSCSKTFKGLKNWNGHRPKCKGPQQLIDKPFKCVECGLFFDSQIGLSQHERHVHPKTRNLKRKEEAERPHGVSGRREYVWSQSEINLLMSLEERFKKSRFPNKEIQIFLPNKTLKQISDKRRGLYEKGLLNINRNVSQETEQNLDVTQQEQSVPSVEENTNTENERVWRDSINKYIESIKIPLHSKFVDLEVSLKTLWKNNKGNPDVLFPLLDKFTNEEIVHKLLDVDTKDKNNKKVSKINKDNKRINNKYNDNNKSNYKNINGNNKKNKNHNQRKKFGYARCQELFNKCPKKLAEHTIKGDFSFMTERQDPPPAANIEELYTDLWGQKGKKDINLYDIENSMPPLNINETIQQITINEIKERIIKIKNKTAAGIDGIKKVHLMQSGTVELLAILFNILLVEGYFPTPWKTNRTTLIPKPEKDLSEVKNWRPITIGSLLSRTFSAVLDSKLRKFVVQSNQQKGFSNEDGCRFNTILLKEVINEMKNRSGGVVTMLDITKAFDTVPHSMIKIGLEKKGVPTHIINFIRSMYQGCKTSIKAAENKYVKIELKRGVKQGDPLSPLLFNLAIEPIINHINKKTTGVPISNKTVSVLAFADDIILIAKDDLEAKKQINYINKYLSDIGMSLSVSKCATFQIVYRNKTWYMKDPQIKIQNKTITNVEPEEALIYLGTKIHPWSNLIKGNEVPSVARIIRNVMRLYLKPHQKIELIQAYILPHFIYSLTSNAPSKGTLKMLDSEIRQCVKEILHLPSSTASGFFYTPKKDGGLGFIKFQNLVPLAVIKNSIRMQHLT